MRRNQNKAIAIAVKGFRKAECKTWEQIMKYQNRGWQIILVK